MGLIGALGDGPTALDACILIYFVEQHPRYAPLLRPLFDLAAAGGHRLYTSTLSLLEVAVGPLRARNTGLRESYERMLTESREVHLVPMQNSSLRVAAELRAQTNLRTPDALQLAAAVESGCRSFLTNDRRIHAAAGLSVFQLEDFAPQG